MEPDLCLAASPWQCIQQIIRKRKNTSRPSVSDTTHFCTELNSCAQWLVNRVPGIQLDRNNSLEVLISSGRTKRSNKSQIQHFVYQRSFEYLLGQMANDSHYSFVQHDFQVQRMTEPESAPVISAREKIKVESTIIGCSFQSADRNIMTAPC